MLPGAKSSSIISDNPTMGNNEVVEIMGNVPGQRADGLHFLGLLELGLEFLALFFCPLAMYCP
jgi:hypothetical protein